MASRGSPATTAVSQSEFEEISQRCSITNFLCRQAGSVCQDASVCWAPEFLCWQANEASTTIGSSAFCLRVVCPRASAQDCASQAVAPLSWYLLSSVLESRSRLYQDCVPASSSLLSFVDWHRGVQAVCGQKKKKPEVRERPGKKEEPEVHPGLQNPQVHSQVLGLTPPGGS